MYTLKALRNNLSIEELAQKLNLTRDAIYKIETNQRIPSLETILKYYQYFRPPAKSFIENLIADLKKLD